MTLTWINPNLERAEGEEVVSNYVKKGELQAFEACLPSAI